MGGDVERMAVVNKGIKAIRPLPPRTWVEQKSRDERKIYRNVAAREQRPRSRRNECVVRDLL